MSVESGVHIVAGTSYYVENVIPKEIKNMTIEQVLYIALKSNSESVFLTCN